MIKPIEGKYAAIALIIVLVGLNVVLAGLVALGPDRVFSAIERRTLSYLGFADRDAATTPVDLLVGEPITNDPLSKYQWGLRMMLEGADYWAIQGDAPRDVVVAVIDRGVHMNHPDLKSRQVSGYNFSDGGNNLRTEYDGKSPNASIGHGQCSASIIAAEVGNSIGMAGVFHRSLIMPLQSDGHIADAIEYAIENGADVILVAGGGGRGMFLWPMYDNSDDLPPSELYSEATISKITRLKSALDDAYKKDIPIITGVGNTQAFGMSLLADDHRTIAVAPHTVFGSVSAHTSFSYSFDVFAPGGSRYQLANKSDLEEEFPDEILVVERYADYDDPLCAFGDDKYSFLTLGSAAMPHIAGAVAMIKSYLPDATVEEIRQILRTGTLPLTPGESLLEGLGGRVSLPLVRDEIDRRASL